MEDACSDPASAIPATPRSILVVEDEVMVRLLIADDLQQAGFRVIQAATAEDGLKVLQCSVEVDLVMTDIRLPGMDGVEFARRVRANWPQLKIVIVSSQDRTKLVGAPVDAILDKPYFASDLVNCVKRLLDS